MLTEPEAKAAYEADMLELSPPWESLGPETKRAYLTGAPRYANWNRARGGR